MGACRGTSGSTLYCSLYAVALGGRSAAASGVAVVQASIASACDAKTSAAALTSASEM